MGLDISYIWKCEASDRPWALARGPWFLWECLTLLQLSDSFGSSLVTPDYDQ